MSPLNVFAARIFHSMKAVGVLSLVSKRIICFLIRPLAMSLYRVKKHLILLALCLTPMQALRARIGETLEQCVERYGEPVRHDEGGIYVFFKGGMSIRCFFHKDKCWSISFLRADLRDLSRDEISTLLERNGGDQKWVPNTDHLYTKRTADGKLFAGLGNSALIISTKEQIENERGGSLKDF